MTSIVRVVLHSRRAYSVLAATGAMCAVAAVTGRRSVEIDLSGQFPPTKLAVVELCAILAATLYAILARPQFWQWDRISGGRRARILAGATAAAGIALPALCVPAAVPGLPANTPWAWVLANALLMSATVQLIAPLLSPLTAGALTLVGWCGCGLAANLAPSLWLPVSTYREPQEQWAVVVVVAVAAVMLHARTCGRTAWAHRQFDKDQ